MALIGPQTRFHLVLGSTTFRKYAAAGAKVAPCYWLRALIPYEWTKVDEDLSQDGFPSFTCGNLEQATSGEKTVWFTDGSGGPLSKDPRLRRVAWAYVGMGPEDQPSTMPLYARYGGMPAAPVGNGQTVPRAELFALIQLISDVSEGHLTVGVDNADTVNGASNRDGSITGKNGDLWLQYWSAVDAHSGTVNVIKVRAHATEEHVSLGLASLQQRSGNMFADLFAGIAADSVAVAWTKQNAVSITTGQAWNIAERIVDIIKHCQDKFGHARKARRAVKNDIGIALDILPCSGKRRLTQYHQTSQENIQPVLKKPKLIAVPHETHQCSVREPFMWCWRCGAWTRDRMNMLKQPCGGHPKGQRGREALSRVRRGLTPISGQDWAD